LNLRCQYSTAINTPEKNYLLKQKVPSLGLKEVLLSNAPSKHIEGQTLVTKFPIQRYSVQDLMRDNEVKTRLLKEIASVIEVQTTELNQLRPILQKFVDKLTEEERARVQIEHKVSAYRSEVQRLQRESQDDQNTICEYSSQINQLTREITILKEASVHGTETELLQKNLRELVKYEDTQLKTLKDINTQLTKERELDMKKKAHLIRQLDNLKEKARTKDQNLLFNFDIACDSDKNDDNSAEEGDSFFPANGSLYGFTVPPIYMKLSNSVVNSPSINFISSYDSDSDSYGSCSSEENENIVNERVARVLKF